MGTIMSQEVCWESESAIAIEMPPRSPPQVINKDVLDPNGSHFFNEFTKTFTDR